MGVACSMPADIHNKHIIIAPWWFNYYSNVTKDLVIYNIKGRKEVRRVSGHKRFPAYAFWIDRSTKAITSSGRNEIICWETKDWSVLFKINEKSSMFWKDHYNFGGIIINGKMKFWSEEFCSR